MQGPGKSWNLLGNDADAVMQAAGAEKLLILLSAVTCIGLYIGLYGLLCVIIVKKMLELCSDVVEATLSTNCH